MKKAAFLVTAGLLLSGCAGSPAVTDVQVTMTEFGFQPSEFSVRAGQPVRMTLVNGGTLEHDFSIMEFPMEMTSNEPAGHEMGSGMEPALHMSAMAGESGMTEFTPTAPGGYEFFCSVEGHKEAGMVGTMTVLAP